jgi:RimJ/RimL family protein N-acetyltransferase
MHSPAFPLVGAACRLRPWTLSDLRSLVRHANNPHVAQQLRDGFPFPYTEADGLAFLQAAANAAPPLSLAIEVQGEAVGGVGVLPRSGNERRTAEIGYWLGEDWWGRGIGPEALRLMTGYAATTFDLARIEAFVMVENTRSCRTLEKAGYQLEGRLRRSFLKDGVLHDQCCYGWIAP